MSGLSFVYIKKCQSDCIYLDEIRYIVIEHQNKIRFYYTLLYLELLRNPFTKEVKLLQKYLKVHIKFSSLHSWVCYNSKYNSL